MTEREEEARPGKSEEGFNCFCMGAGPELFGMFRRMGPEAARKHFRNARLEVLRGMRAVIDYRIEELSKSEGRKGTKVNVE
jgi:hypothetical protein